VKALGLIETLSLALFHDWEPEKLFVILTLYIDESGTHGGSPSTVMAGVLGDVGQWARFRTGLARLKLEFGFDHFRAKEFRQRTGRFAGWSAEKSLLLIDKLVELTANKMMDTLEFVFDNKAYNDRYRGKEKHKKLVLDSKYGLCFRHCMYYFILSIVRKFPKRPEDGLTLNVVVESGHKNAGAALVIFNELKREAEGHGAKDLLGVLSFAAKDQCDELMMPDFISHMALQQDRRRHAGLWKPPSDARNVEGPESFDGPGDIVHLEFQPDGLADVRSRLDNELQERLARSDKGNQSG
jgi:hypothetical protein